MHRYLHIIFDCGFYFKMCEVVEISDDEEEENVPVCISNSPSSVDECSQSSCISLTATSSSLDSAPLDVCPADRKKVVLLIFEYSCNKFLG